VELGENLRTPQTPHGLDLHQSRASWRGFSDEEPAGFKTTDRPFMFWQHLFTLTPIAVCLFLTFSSYYSYSLYHTPANIL